MKNLSLARQLVNRKGHKGVWVTSARLKGRKNGNADFSGFQSEIAEKNWRIAHSTNTKKWGSTQHTNGRILLSVFMSTGLVDRMSHRGSGNGENVAAAKQSQVRQSNQLVLSFFPFSV